MPLYVYRCLKCKSHIEKIERLNGPFLKKCPHCGGKVESVITASAIRFKGTGWYVTDYGRKTSGGDGSKSAGTAKSGNEGKSPESGSKPVTPAKEGKKAVVSSKEK